MLKHIVFHKAYTVCSIFSALAMGILDSCTEPSSCNYNAEGSQRPPGCGQPRPPTPGRGISGRPHHVTTVLFLSRGVKITQFNQNLPVVLTSLNVSNSKFRKFIMFCMWRHHGRAFWRHGGSAWHNGLFLPTASNDNCFADVVNTVAWLGRVVDFDHRITG